MRRAPIIALLCGVCCVLALPARAQMVGPEFLTQAGSVVINLDGSVPASQLEVALVWYAPAYSKDDGSVNSLQCLATARNRGEIKRGMSLALEGEIFDVDDDTLSSLSRKTRPFNPAARFSWDFPDFSSTESAVGFLLEGELVGGQMVDFVKLECRAINRFRCRDTRDTLCVVGNNRFRVQVDVGSNQGLVDVRSTRWGWFSSSGSGPSNVYVEMFDRCGMNDHFWVAVGSLTGASFEVVVEDTLSGETRSFSNPGNGMILLDQAAFATCP